MNKKYCNNLTKYSRRESRIVSIGKFPLGGHHPIRVQSMTTTDTMNTVATVEQSIRMINAGCEYVRVTTPSINEARNLENIKNELVKRGYETPLVADVHYTPKAAEIAATIVEKVRINPGNFADKKKFESVDYSDSEYETEIDRINERFTPLVHICKENGTAMRIGTNHGSLSDRILNRFGDTPLGMVESALEFIRICESHNYHDIVLSMKSSNPIVMVQAYRLLVNKMDAENMNYPLHLGVTEAGDGSAGRIKSALGIGTLLEDGLGDTIRVSLTEEPEIEIPVVNKLIRRLQSKVKHDSIEEISVNPINPFEHNKRFTNKIDNIGGSNTPVVIADFNLVDEINASIIQELGYSYDSEIHEWKQSDIACDFIDIGKKSVPSKLPPNLGVIQAYSVWKENKVNNVFPFIDPKQYLENTEFHPRLNFIYMTLPKLTKEVVNKLKSDSTAVIISDTYNDHGIAEQRRLFMKLMNAICNTPVIIGRAYADLSVETLQLHSATDMGALFVDGLGDGVYIASENCGSVKSINEIAFGILQASRTRITKTDYISCPSCGRTLFDLQSTTAKIKEVTSHLKGLKIGVMGCIVNGPGEMADANYGYVGTGSGLISLYKGQKMVQKNLSENDAVESLIELIKENGDWSEPVC